MIHTIDINQIRFTDFYRLTTPGVTPNWGDSSDSMTTRKEGKGRGDWGERERGSPVFSPPPLPFLAPATESSPYVDNLCSLSLPVTTSSPGRFSLALEVPLSNQSQRKAPWGRGWSHHATFLQRGSIGDELVETKNLFTLVALRPLRTVCHFSVHTIRTDGNMNCTDRYSAGVLDSAHGAKKRMAVIWMAVIPRKLVPRFRTRKK